MLALVASYLPRLRLVLDDVTHADDRRPDEDARSRRYVRMPAIAGCRHCTDSPVAMVTPLAGAENSQTVLFRSQQRLHLPSDGLGWLRQRLLVRH